MQVVVWLPIWNTFFLGPLHPSHIDKKIAHHGIYWPQCILKAVFRLLLILVLCMMQISWLKYNSHEMLQCHYKCLLIKWNTDFTIKNLFIKKKWTCQSPKIPLLINFKNILSINSIGHMLENRNACIFIFIGDSIILSQTSTINVCLLWLLGKDRPQSLTVFFSFCCYFKLPSSVWQKRLESVRLSKGRVKLVQATLNMQPGNYH